MTSVNRVLRKWTRHNETFWCSSKEKIISCDRACTSRKKERRRRFKRMSDRPEKEGEPPKKKQCEGGSSQTKIPDSLSDVFKISIPISYERTFRMCLGFWKNKTSKAAQALLTGKRYVEPPQFPGIVRLHSTRNDFTFGVEEWQPYQSEVFEMFVNANILNILGEDSDMCLESVMRDSGWVDIPDEELVLASRGSGKSTVLAVSAAAFLKNIKRYTAMVYSGIKVIFFFFLLTTLPDGSLPLKEKSEDLLNSIYAAFEGMRNRDEDFQCASVQKTKTSITVSVATGDVRQVHCCSSFGMVSNQQNTCACERFVCVRARAQGTMESDTVFFSGEQEFIRENFSRE